MADTAKQLADAEKNHNRLKKLGTTEATKEFGSYPKYIEALKETRLKLNDAKADHEDSASDESKEPEKVEQKPASKTSKAKEPNKDKGWEQIKKDTEKLHAEMRNADPADYKVLTKEEIQKAHQDDIKDIMSTKEKRIKEAEENYEKLKKLGSVKFDTYAEYTKALSNSREEVDEAKSDHGSMAKLVARAKRDWNDNPFDSKAEYKDSVSDEAKETVKKPEPEKVEEKPASKDKEPWEMTKAERGTPDGGLASRGAFKTKKDAQAKLTELMGKLDKGPQTKAILDQFGMDSSNTFQVVKSKQLSNRWEIAATHRHEVAAAIMTGKSVPAEVMADYPDLVKKPEPAKAKEPSKMTQEEVSSKLDELFFAPQKETGKPRVAFATKTEESAFRRGFQTGSDTPHGTPPPGQTGLSPKDRKYEDAQRQGWSHGAMAGRAIEKLRNDIKESKTVSAAAPKDKEPERVEKKPATAVEPATPPKEPVAEVKEMKKTPKQQEFDLTPAPEVKKEEKPVEAKEDAPKGKGEVNLFPKEAKELYAIQANIKELMERARGTEPGSPERKAVEKKEEEKSNKLVELGLPKPPKPQKRGGEGVLKERIVPLPPHGVVQEDGSVKPYQTRAKIRSPEEIAKEAADKEAARVKVAADRMAKAEALKPAQVPVPKVDKLPVVPSPVTPKANLETGDGGTEKTNPVTGKGTDVPGDQEAGGGVPPPKKTPEPKKVLAPLTPDQSKPIYEASASADNSLQALNNLPNGHPDRKAFWERYVDHRNILSQTLKAAGRDPLPRTGDTKVLKEDHGLPKDLLQGAGEHRKAQEEEKASREAFAASFKEAPAPTQRIEPTFTQPRIESMVGSKSPLPQTQPQPQAQVPAPVAPAAPAPTQTAPPAAGAAPVAPAPWFPFGQGEGQAPWVPHGDRAAPVPAAPVPAPVPPAPSGRGSQAANQAAAASGAKPVDQGQFAPSKPQPQVPAPVVPQTAPSAPAPRPQPQPAPTQQNWLAEGQKQIAAAVKPEVQAKIEELSAQRKTAKQVAKELGLDEDQVRAVRFAMKIPSMPGLKVGLAQTEGEQDDKDKFEAWVKGYKSRQTTSGTPAPVPQSQPAPAGATSVPQSVPPAPTQPKPQPQQQQPAPGKPQQPGTPQPKPPFNPFQRTEPAPAQPKPKPPFNPFERIENKVAPRTGRPKQQPETKTQPVPIPVPVPAAPAPVQQQPMSRYEKVKRALASVGQGIGRAATSASQGVQRAATHGITKAALAHLGVAALHGVNYHKAIKNLGQKQPRKFNPGWHGFTTPVGKPEDEAKAAEQQKAPVEPKETAEPKTSGKWERRDR